MSQAEKQVNEAEEQLTQAEEAKKKAEREQTAHLALVSEQNEREKELARLSALRSQYTDMEALQKNANAAKAVMDGAKKTRQDAMDSAAAELEKLKQLEAAWNNAEQEYKSLSDAYKAVAIGHLAAALQEGEPCPVCGNRHHPCPAILPNGAVTAKNVEDAEKKVGKARKAFNDQKTAKDNAEGVQKEADSAFQNAKSEYDKAAGALNNALAQRDPEINTLQELNERCIKLKGLIKGYNDKKNSLSAAYTQVNIVFGTIEGTLKDRKKKKDDASAEYIEKETAWKRALEETGLRTETQYNAMAMSVDAQNELRTTLANHEAARHSAYDAVKEQLAKLEGKVRPDVESAERMFTETEEKYNDAISARTIAVQRHENLEKEAKQLIDLHSRIADRRKAYEDDSAFVRVLRGSVGMSIQRFVLSVRLNQVIVEANRLLQGIYGGRYRLHRSNESYGSSHKSGLELEVYDSMNDQQRSVCTLSGGEKFLVALSLAIGLCTVVQNEQKGVNLEAMFIDEGFGSLDQSSLGDALDILQGVRRGRGLVGIISHIPMLEETIPTKIIVEKTAHGSVKKEVYG
mgnify:CR=1 FL=1